MTPILASVVRNTTLDTISASLLYLVARIEVDAAAGIDATRMTTKRSIPVSPSAQAMRSPSPNPTPIRKNEASSVVGNEVALTFDML